MILLVIRRDALLRTKLFFFLFFETVKLYPVLSFYSALYEQTNKSFYCIHVFDSFYVSPDILSVFILSLKMKNFLQTVSYPLK